MALLYRVLRVALFILIVALVVAVTMGVTWRYGFGHSLFWATEVPNFLFVWIVFLGTVVAFHERKHIALTVLVEHMPPRLRTGAEIAVLLAILATCAFLLVTGSIVVRDTMGSPSEALKIPQGYLYSVVPIASVLIGIEALVAMARRLREIAAARLPA
jgi:TRAP-type C4-dicarboxylate transport system permease small subunit